MNRFQLDHRRGLFEIKRDEGEWVVGVARGQAFDSDIQQGCAAREIRPRLADNRPISQFFDDCRALAPSAGAAELDAGARSEAAVRI